MATGGHVSTHPTVVMCHECDLAHAYTPLNRAQRAKCMRCEAHLYGTLRDDLDRPLALAITGMLLILVANFSPFLTFEMEGRGQTSSLISGSAEFWRAGFGELAIIVFLSSICLPFFSLALTLYLIMPLRLGFKPWQSVRVLRWIVAIRPWAMMEVYMLGALVAIVKLTDFADIVLEPGFYAFAVLILVVAATNLTLHAEPLWQRIGKEHTAVPHSGTDENLTGCHACGLASPGKPEEHGHKCPRCDTQLHHRKPNSLSRTWALLIAAAIFYIPANIYPIMTVISFGQGAPDTILSGVIHLIEAGQWPIATLVFFASVFVPILKIVILLFLLLSVHADSDWRQRERTAAYRLTEFIGRWSMIDIFMISILVALVKLDAVATIEAGPGAVAFAAVVIFTMLSAMSFDSRLIWDRGAAKDD